MAGRIKCVKGRYDLGTEKAAATVEAKVTDECTFSCTHRQDEGLVSAELDGKNWTVAYYPVKKDLKMSMKHKFNGFDLKVTQVVPGMEWSLIPSPLLQIDTQLVKKDNLTDDVELHYDMRTRRAGVKQKLKIKDKHECVWSIDSAQKFDGASLSWKTKFNEPSVKSLSASYSHKVGPSLLYEVEPSSKTELGVKVFTRTQTFKGEVTYKPEDVNNAEIGLVMTKSLKDDKKPQAAVFCKWVF